MNPTNKHRQGDTTMTLSTVAQAYERCRPMRRALAELGARPIERTEDPAGIVWERFVLPNEDGTSVVLLATPHWWDLYTPVHIGNDALATVNAARALCGREALTVLDFRAP
jgi:hypothetical protein